jgi:hypothetical protein
VDRLRYRRTLAAHLWWGGVATSAVLMAGLPVCGLLRGGDGVAGFAAGVGLVVASNTLSSALFAWSLKVARWLVLPLGLTTYVSKFAAIIALLVALDGTNWAGVAPLGIGMIVSAVAWSAAQIVWIVRTGLPQPAGSSGIPACQPRKA